MSRTSILPQSRHHIMVYDEDWDFIEQRFCQDSGKTPGVLIRDMLHRRVLELRERENQALSGLPAQPQAAPQETKS